MIVTIGITQQKSYAKSIRYATNETKMDEMCRQAS
jgi:hypothetical protein